MSHRDGGITDQRRTEIGLRSSLKRDLFMRDNASPDRKPVQQLRQARRQGTYRDKKKHNRGVMQWGRPGVAFVNADAIGKVCPSELLSGNLTEFTLRLESNAATPAFSSGLNKHSSVATTDIDQQVIAGHAGEAQ